MSTTLNRDASLRAMSNNELDILVIGGGITGAGIALDAATRGLKVGIVEAQDFAQGTSSRSSKLVHGGLRYLYNFDFLLVAEALRERGLLLSSLAPHLVKAQPFLWPLKMPVIERSYSAIGVGLYDAMAQIAHKGSVPIQKHYSKSGALSLFPDIKEDQITGAIRFYDARVDDARLVITLIRTAARYGAYTANRTQVVNLEKEGFRVTGAVVRDLETGKEYTIKAKNIINATGVWTEQTQALADTSGGLKVLASKGIHIVIPKDRIKGKTGLFLRTEKSVLFIIPWKRYWVIGTTDTKYHEDFVNPVANKEDIDYILDHANAVLTSDLTHDDIIGTWAGLRPLLQPGTADGDKTKSTKISREHTVTEAAPGLTVIAGGKLTTYRVMAEDAVDFALGANKAKQMPSRTQLTPLIGADGYHALWNRREELAAEYQLSVDHIEDLLDRYGSDIFTLLESIKEEETLGHELGAAPEYLRAEIAFACTHEGALHLEDIMVLRTRLNHEKKDRGLAAVLEIADLAAVYLGWDEERKQHEIDSYQQRCEAEARAEDISGEHEAQEIRAQVESVAPMLS
ncbi:glycerol-3-phosphate dehydrogenase/oxidase [Corynebacterium sp. ES2730-CONJ]|uniref:glycerol-3-phosphate dehydrogenase/oxidase n=1 Tax=Corynebacterium sp. ES2730-CONJ TaxID=2973941 RepID=UPI00216AC692|nr:glycerol-3-phosphate dehydrogenase/oxidase [Corynebacterium sp. ES2730-CONJ]MCS4532160.1 glycerol-3-phosphate dehydrogenase/oxidase [Corynebacterium sp. ES2730-CONJ]